MSGGRPKEYHGERVATAIRMPKALHERLTEAAAEREVAANLLVTKAIEEYLDRLVPVDDLLQTRAKVAEHLGGRE